MKMLVLFWDSVYFVKNLTFCYKALQGATKIATKVRPYYLQWADLILDFLAHPGARL